MSEQNKQKLKRPPVVVVVGHVDHGKTSLLDYIRKTTVAAKEAGGITQSIGAYEISHKDSRITFIDTPGHEAFSKMRIRGARVADIGILVVAGDESVKPQTKEAVKALQDSQTPFVVAITKIDKPNTDLDRVKNDLTSNNVLLEGYGGNVSYQGVSVKTGEGVNELLDLILLTAEVGDLVYDPNHPASGIVLEAKLENRRGNTVTIILKDGVLRKGDLIATATAKGKIKILEDFWGKPAEELSPSSPAVIFGFDGLPLVGEEFIAGKLSSEQLDKVQAVKKEIFQRSKNKHEEAVRVILKADVAGSLEALEELLRKIPLKENQYLDVLARSVGEISDGDIKEAVATNSVILGFRTYPNKAAENLARAKNVKIITNEIIYKLVEEIQMAFEKLGVEDYGTELEVLALFSSGNSRQTVGGRVNRGQMRIKAKVDIQRNGDVIGQGKISSLQEGKKETTAVDTGKECGLQVETNVKIEVGDRLLLK